MEDQSLKIKTEDGKLVAVGDRVYDYYDMVPGIISEISRVYSEDDGVDPNYDIWFELKKEGGGTVLLNGQRICTIAYAQRRGFRFV